MFYEDLSSYSSFLKTPVEGVKNVGWLSSDIPFSKGLIDSNILVKLLQIIKSSNTVNFHVNPIRGMHPCNLCGCDEVKIDNEDVWLGSSELWIPSTDGKTIFAVPTLIYHYIETHQYKPPQEFIDTLENFDISRYFDFNSQKIYLRLVKGYF